MSHKGSFFCLALVGNQHIQIQMQRNPQHHIDEQDESNVAVRQQQQS